MSESNEEVLTLEERVRLVLMSVADSDPAYEEAVREMLVAGAERAGEEQ